MKIKHKIFLQFILLIVLVSGAIISTNLQLFKQSRDEVLETVSGKLRSLQEVSSNEMIEARNVAYQGIVDASGLVAIDHVTEISLSNQRQFFNVVQEGIDQAGERIASTLAVQRHAVEEGLRVLLKQTTDTIAELVETDKASLTTIADETRENVSYLQWASQEGLQRLKERREKMATELYQLAQENNDELDILLAGLLQQNDFSIQQERALATRFHALKRSISTRQEHFFSVLFDDIDEQRKVLGEEINIAATNVRWFIEQEESHIKTAQQRRIQKVTAHLLQEKGRLRYQVDQLATAVNKTIDALKDKLPDRLKTESNKTNQAIAEQIHLAKAGTTATQNRMASRIAVNAQKANSVFDTAIRESNQDIGETFANSQKRAAHLSLIIALSCGLLAMGLGFVIIRTLMRPISQVLYFADRMAGGDLSQRLPEGTDEMGEVGRALNRMADDLQKLQEATINSFTDTLDRVLDCIFMFDPEDMRFTYVNQGAIDQLGYSREQFPEMTPLDIQPEMTRERFLKMTEHLKSDVKEVSSFVTVHRNNQGDDIPVEVLLRYVTPPGNEPRFVAVVRDISDRIRERREKEQMQAELMHSQKLESVGQLAAGIAHEINTPIQFIGSNIAFLSDTVTDLKIFFDALQERMVEWPEDVRATLAETIDELDWVYLEEELPTAIHQTQDGVERVTSLVAAMKRFSHPESREKTACDLHEMISTALTVSRNEWKYVADVETAFDPELPFVPLFADQMGQVVVNMMVNAAHAIEEKMKRLGTEEMGRITITTRKLAQEVEIIFADTGNGIPQSILKKVFDPFFTTKEVGKGSGQGLAICYNVITKKHGGSLNVESEEGTGTRFILRLPLTIDSNTEDVTDQG